MSFLNDGLKTKLMGLPEVLSACHEEKERTELPSSGQRSAATGGRTAEPCGPRGEVSARAASRARPSRPARRPEAFANFVRDRSEGRAVALTGLEWLRGFPTSTALTGPAPQRRTKTAPSRSGSEDPKFPRPLHNRGRGGAEAGPPG